jgi:lactate permease
MAAEMMGITPYITTSLNVAGGVLGKIVSLQSIAVGLSAVGSEGSEDIIMRRLIGYSLALTSMLGLIAYLTILA